MSQPGDFDDGNPGGGGFDNLGHGVGSAYFVQGSDAVRGAVEQFVNDVPDAVKAQGPDQQRPLRKVFVLVLAHPSHAFAATEIFPLIPQWNSRSAEFIDFLFPGFASPDIASFNDAHFNEVIAWLERDIEGFEYTGQTMLCMFSSEASNAGPSLPEPIDRSAVVFLDLEQLIEKKILSSPRVVFEQLIRMATKWPGDNVLWMFGEEVVNQRSHEAMVAGGKWALLTTLKHFLGVEAALPASVESTIKAKYYLRVRDGRRNVPSR